MDREFQRRNNENMWQLFEALMGENPKPFLAPEQHEDTECDYSLEQTLAADERGDEDRESTEELPGH